MGKKVEEGRYEGESETAQARRLKLSVSVDIVVNVKWSQIHDSWLGGTPLGPSLKSLRFLVRWQRGA